MPTDREMLREKLKELISDVTRCYGAVTDRVLAHLEAEYEPLRKKEPRYIVRAHYEVTVRYFDVVRASDGHLVAAFYEATCPNAEAEARSLAEKLNAADRKEK